MSAFRWRGLCLGCFRTADVETRYEHDAKALCDACFAARTSSTPRLPTIDGPVELHVSDEEEARWRAERRQRYGDDDRGRLLPKRQPDAISRVLARLKAVGLPVVGVGLPDVVGSRCPLCGAGMRVGLRRDHIDLTCGAGTCAEADIAAWIRTGGQR